MPVLAFSSCTSAAVSKQQRSAGSSSCSNSSVAVSRPRCAPIASAAVAGVASPVKQQRRYVFKLHFDAHFRTHAHIISQFIVINAKKASKSAS